MPLPFPNLLLMPAHLIHSRGSSVSGPTDPTYLPAWLCDGSSARPLRGTSGGGTYTASFPASGTVNFVSLINSNVSVNVTVGGGVAGTLFANPRLPDGSIRNPYIYSESGVGGVGSVSITIAGNPTTVVLGELVAGEAWELERHPERMATREYWAKSVPRADDVDFLPDYDLNGYGRNFDGTVVLTDDGLEQMEAMWTAQRGFSRGCVIVPTPTLNDAWYGRLTSFSFSKELPGVYHARIQFREYAQARRE